MPPGSVPSWAVTSSSAALFGNGGSSGSKSNGRAAADAHFASSSNKTDASNTASQIQRAVEPPLRPVNVDNSTSATAATHPGEHEKPYQPKRKQRSITHCLPPTSTASSSRRPNFIPHVDEASANEALFQLIAVQAKRAGFDATTASALHEVSQLTKKFLTSVFSAANHAAELSSRDQPSARDLLYALETHGQPIRELHDFSRQQDGVEQDERSKASADARARAKQHAAAPKTYMAWRKTTKAKTDLDAERDDAHDWKQGSDAFLPSDSDDGSELDAWSASSDSDDEHGNRRADIHARVMKRKHDKARALVKKERRQAKLRQPTSHGEQGQSAPSSSSSSSARDLRALTSGEQAWRRVADHIVPRHLPGMPPRHAWMQTPAFPTNAYSSSLGGVGDPDDESSKGRKDPLVLVNRKLANARLVEASLRRLIQNTDGAAAAAYATSSTRNGATTGSTEASTLTSTQEKEVAGTAGSSAVPATAAFASATAAAASGGFAIPKTPASGGSGGLTLRLNRKVSLPASAFNSPSTPSTPIGSRRPSNAAFVGSGAGGATGASGVPGTPLGVGMSMGWGGEPLMSPLTPASAAGGGPMTPYPPTPGGVYGHYFGSQPNATNGGGGYRSRSQSVVAANTNSYAGGDSTANEQLGVRVPGPINYKNVWYAPGSTIASGGLAGGGASAKSASGANSNHPRSVKRMRKWKV